MTYPFPILVAEDNPVSRKLLEKTLLKAGHNVTAVSNGKEALELFKDTFFPIVLTDWMMPEMDGVALCRAIRQNANDGYVFIVLLTAKDGKDDIVTGLEAGADDYLTKPFSRAELIARLNTGRRILELERSLKEAKEEIEKLSRRDPLTGVYNRGQIQERLPQEIKRSRRYGRPLSVILCDIDHFKKVNDLHGHQTGDLVLQHFAGALAKGSREDVDWVARYGGEEFLIVLPETPYDGACLMGERLRQRIEKTEMPANGTRINITASFGVTALGPETREDEATMERLINVADVCLYLAKREGRNRVIGNPL